ncbi:MAG: serine/threonine protein phosphatase, partial [Lachnospiraceae bacterium]|nr:serine/threonine protein phosphatase [Lachnospiraceae bacterium]
MSTKSRLDALYLRADKICISANSRIVLMSDCHRGVGNHGDNFLYNQNLAAAALSYYNRRQFTYVELGDGDELWENRRIGPVIRMHDDIFEILSHFYRQGRFFMLYGNHDRKKEQPQFMERYYTHYYCENQDCYQELFPQLAAKEGLI